MKPEVKEITESNIICKQIDLRPFKQSDAKDIYEHINDADVVRWTLSIPHPYSLKLGQEFIEKTQKDWRDKKGYVFALVLKETDAVIGCVGIEKIDWENKNAELGYWLGKRYWGKGIMNEALNLALRFAFEELKLHRIQAPTRPPQSEHFKKSSPCRIS